MIPLIIVAFNRPDKLQRIVDAVRRQTVKPYRIIGILDGPLGRAGVSACLSILDGVADDIISRDSNFGCASNIMFGVNETLSRFGAAVVLEDDVLPARHWYEAMCLLMDRYKDDSVVAAVGSHPSVLNGGLSGYNYDVILSPRFSCWGWGTWKSKWDVIFSEWKSYLDNGHTTWDPAKLPGYAGHDISNMVLNHTHGQLWDGVVAGSFLHHGFLQAIPRFYLVNNIGAGSHIPDSKVRFMMEHNPIDDRVPTSFPLSSVLDSIVSSAVCDYVRIMA